MRKLVGLLLVATLQPALAADMWGCEVLLCLSNPAGPMAVKECIPPIKKLYKAIFKWKPDPFPTCAFVSAPGGGSTYAAPQYELYQQCPAPLTALPAAAYAVQGTLADLRTQNENPENGPLQGAAQYRGIGEGDNNPGRDVTDLAQKVCVGQFLGHGTFSSGPLSDVQYSYQLPVYDRVELFAPSMRMVIKVYIDGVLTTVVKPE